MTNTVQLQIGGYQQDAADHRTFERRNPLDDAVVTIAAAASIADANAAADAAALAFGRWAELGPNARRMLLLKAADMLKAREADFIEAMADEIGATVDWAKFNVSLAASMVREAAALTTQVAGEVIPSDKPGCIAMSVREPAGVCLGIAPWNAPVILGVRAIATPLACGNTVVLKASEICARTHALIVEVFEAAGLTGGVVNLITNAPADAADVVGALIDHPSVRRINFTGSTQVGRIVAERAARNLKPALLELGGKAPLLVLEDADLDEAVKAAAFGAFFNQGQICMSTERVIVVDAVADAFVDRFRARAADLIAGNPRRGDTPLGAMVSRQAAARLRELVVEAESKGGVCLTGGHPDGVLASATVIDRVSVSMAIWREESFGPVVGVIRARDEMHAVELANDTEYGLSAAVFTRDIAKGLKVARQIRSGICHINGPTVHDEAQMPFGGVKSSGYGRFGGRPGIAEFTDLRWITIDTQTGHFPI